MYSVNLMDCKGPSSADKSTAENLYKEAIEKYLGGDQAVVRAYSQYMSVFAKYEELPLPKDATQQEQDAVALWDAAHAEGVDAAFAGWFAIPDAAHFDIYLPK